MSGLLSVMGSAILPVLSIAGIGYVLARVKPIETDALATISIYVLLPALVFYSLSTSTIAGGTIVGFLLGTVVFTVGMAGLSEGVGRTVADSGGIIDGTVMTGVFPNSGNYGIPFMAFAFGAVGRSAAVLFLVGQSLVMYTLGVYVAARGSDVSYRVALNQILRLPLLYATVVALLARWLGTVPATDTTFMRTVELVGNAAIPVMILILGMELAYVGEVRSFARVVPGATLKLLVAPVVAGAIALAFGLSGTIGRVFVLEAAMPTAVTPVALTIEFGSGTRGDEASEYIASAVLVTTLASVITLSMLLAFLTSGWSPI